MFLEKLSCFALIELPRFLLAIADAGMEVSKRSECLESQRPYMCRGVSAGGGLNTRPLVGGGALNSRSLRCMLINPVARSWNY